MFIFRVAFYDDTGRTILVVPVEAENSMQAEQAAQILHPQEACEAKSVVGWVE
jgi:hypothetical protein